ncbi:hypothetical protein CYMTET_38078 [Cymbomonas tetramitiformis]|uniref:Uncharacterized protein n=1 Tax=Cymbomonas tetramitiformis TaxID=36881 RepID=A0AAE0CE73_9CHLO|nr:hypothetical protein CYMTET_38078 [Cymbomonas tetramitiformis]
MRVDVKPTVHSKWGFAIWEWEFHRFSKLSSTDDDSSDIFNFNEALPQKVRCCPLEGKGRDPNLRHCVEESSSSDWAKHALRLTSKLTKPHPPASPESAIDEADIDAATGAEEQAENSEENEAETADSEDVSSSSEGKDANTPSSMDLSMSPSKDADATPAVDSDEAEELDTISAEEPMAQHRIVGSGDEEVNALSFGNQKKKHKIRFAEEEDETP